GGDRRLDSPREPKPRTNLQRQRDTTPYQRKTRSAEFAVLLEYAADEASNAARLGVGLSVRRPRNFGAVVSFYGRGEQEARREGLSGCDGGRIARARFDRERGVPWPQRDARGTAAARQRDCPRWHQR